MLNKGQVRPRGTQHHKKQIKKISCHDPTFLWAPLQRQWLQKTHPHHYQPLGRNIKAHRASLPTSCHLTSHHNTPLSYQIRPPISLISSTSQLPVTVPSWSVLPACPFPQPFAGSIHLLSLSPDTATPAALGGCLPLHWTLPTLLSLVPLSSAALKPLHKNHNTVNYHTLDDTFLSSAALDLWLLLLPTFLQKKDFQNIFLRKLHLHSSLIFAEVHRGTSSSHHIFLQLSSTTRLRHYLALITEPHLLKQCSIWLTCTLLTAVHLLDLLIVPYGLVIKSRSHHDAYSCLRCPSWPHHVYSKTKILTKL